MTDCQDWLGDITHTANRILNEDLAALKRMPEERRLDRYKQLVDDEDEFRWEFTKECSDFLTGSEEDYLRGELRLAQLLIAASFYADGDVPDRIDGDFIEPELQAVVEFDRFKTFDSLDDDQLDERVRRLDGEVAELIEEYASTQIANIEDLLDNPEVQQDVVERLLERYEDRRERIRAAVSRYAETHGLDQVSATIGGAIGDDFDAGAAGIETDGTGRPAGDGATATQAGSQRVGGATTGQASARAGGDERDGTGVVTAGTARLFELDYLGRFETTMYETTRIRLPDETFRVPDDYWDGRHGRRDEADRMEELLADDGGGDLDAHPHNPSARYEITAPKYFGLAKQSRMVIEATVYSHLETHAAEGYDATPAGADDLASVVGDAVREAAGSDTPYLLGIASPTGWTDELVHHVREDELSRSRYSRQVSVCLIDLRRGELIYDDSDPVAANNSELYERSVNAEAVANCVSQLREAYMDSLDRSSVLLTELVDETEFDRHVVKQAFARLEDDGDAEQFYLDERGVALDFA